MLSKNQFLHLSQIFLVKNSYNNVRFKKVLKGMQMTKSPEDEKIKVQRLHPCRMVRGDNFQVNLGRLVSSSFYKIFTESLYSRRRTLSQQETSYRVLSHWDLEGLLECERDSEKGWRKFNVVEILWLQIIQELRKLGLPIGIIRTTKAYFFEHRHDSDSIPYLDYYLTAAMGFNKPVYMLVFPDGTSEFLEYNEYQNALALRLLGSHVNLSLNDMLAKIQLKKGTTPHFPLELELPPELASAFEFVKEETCESATIHKKNGEVDRVELNQKPSNDTRLHELLNQSENQDIMIKKRNGQVILMTQTKIKKV
jgi:DNA-binding transcriptional MerR regulator